MSNVLHLTVPMATSVLDELTIASITGVPIEEVRVILHRIESLDEPTLSRIVGGSGLNSQEGDHARSGISTQAPDRILFGVRQPPLMAGLETL